MNDSAISAKLANLVARARGGDPVAIEELSGQCRRLVLDFLTGLNADEAEDLTQELLGSLPRRLATYEESGRFPAWLRSVAFNLFRTRSRSIRRRREAPLDEQVDVALAERTTTLFRTRKLELRAAAADLSPALKLAWDLYAQGYEPQAIAARLGISAGAAATRVSRAKDELERKLRGEPNPGSG